MWWEKRQEVVQDGLGYKVKEIGFSHLETPLSAGVSPSLLSSEPFLPLQ